MASLKKWFETMERMGEADVPMEINGEWMTPREYMSRRGG